MEGQKTKDYKTVQRQQQKESDKVQASEGQTGYPYSRKFRLIPDVASKFLKEWAASEAAPDNHDKNLMSTTGEIYLVF